MLAGLAACNGLASIPEGILDGTSPDAATNTPIDAPLGPDAAPAPDGQPSPVLGTTYDNVWGEDGSVKQPAYVPPGATLSALVLDSNGVATTYPAW